jgi:hypothetical protein
MMMMIVATVMMGTRSTVIDNIHYDRQLLIEMCCFKSKKWCLML